MVDSTIHESRLMSLLNRVRTAIQSYELLIPGQPVVLGVSGGPDSLCMLHALAVLAAEYSVSLHVGHLEHGIRGAESHADADFVAETCQSLNIPYDIEHANVPLLAEQSKRSLEQAARQTRYAFLARIARRIGSQTVAVAHNADDQVETVLLHLLRGTGLAGLQGMRPLATLDETDGTSCSARRQATGPLRIIRPLLGISRQEVETYCLQQGLEPHLDVTNLVCDNTRNRIRHELVPLMTGYNPRLRETLGRMATSIATDYDYLQTQSEAVWQDTAISIAPDHVSLNLRALRELHPSQTRAMLRKSFHLLIGTSRDLEWIHVADACQLIGSGHMGDHLDLPQDLALTLQYDCLIMHRQHQALPRPDWPRLQTPVPGLPIPGCVALPGSTWTITTERITRADLPADWASNSNPMVAYLSEERLPAHLELRTRRPGDRFLPLGGHHPVSLREFMINQKIPEPERATLPLLVSGDEIIWVVGWRVGQYAAIEHNTQRVVVVRLEQSQKGTS